MRIARVVLIGAALLALTPSVGSAREKADDAPFFGMTVFSANQQMHQVDFNIVANLAPAGSTIRPRQAVT